jgi:hypothetical protein
MATMFGHGTISRMSIGKIGGLPRRYTFLLNPHADMRLSRCPVCDKLTYPRKFALLISVKSGAMITLGKTCKYCSRCEMIMCQQDELEMELAIAAARHVAAALGGEYSVIGTVARKTWQAGIAHAAELDDLLANISEFKKYRGLSITPGGWYREGYEPAPLPASRPQFIPRTCPLE